MSSPSSNSSWRSWRPLGWVTDERPIVAVNQNSGNPHYEPRPDHSAPMRAGNFVLLDVWAKQNRPGAVYYDVTWVGYIARNSADCDPPEEVRQIFEIVREARDLGVEFVASAVRKKRPVGGWEVDQAVRSFIAARGYGEYFPPSHRPLHRRVSARLRRQPRQFGDRRTSAKSSPIRAFRSSRASTCPSSACAAR